MAAALPARVAPMNLTRATALSVLVVPVLALSACGGGGKNDKDKITDIVNQGSKDPATICDHLAAAPLKALGGKAKCLVASKAGDADANFKISSVTIDGDKASVKGKGKEGSQTIKFVKEDGDWKVTT